MSFGKALMSRRAFLVHSSAAVAAAVAASHGLSQAADGKSANIRFGFTSYQWGQDWDVPTTIANCTKAGVLGVETRAPASGTPTVSNWNSMPSDAAKSASGSRTAP